MTPLDPAGVDAEPRGWKLESGNGERLAGASLRARIALLSDELTRLCNHERPRSTTHRIALLSDNSIDAALLFECARQLDIGLVPIPPFFTPQQIQHAVRTTQCDLLIADRRCDGAAQDETLAGVDGFVTRLTHDPDSLPRVLHRITFTSGSTGAPKGIALNSRSLSRAGDALSRAVAAGPADRHLALLPLSLLLEEVVALHAARQAGATVTLPSLADVGFTAHGAIDGDRLLATVERHEPTVIVLTPELLATLVAVTKARSTNLDSIRFAAVGGAPVSTRLIAEAHDVGIPAYEGYGLSETCSCVALNTPLASRDGAVGRPLPGYRVDVETDGEIIVSGNTMLGSVDTDGFHPAPTFVRTGDLGAIDDDGYLSIHGRKKHLIITSHGRNISPEWIERTLEGHPEISRALVFGDGDVALSAIVEATAGASDLAIAKAIDRANARLPIYARIDRWVRLKTPLSRATGTLTPMGKLARSAILAVQQDEWTRDPQSSERMQP